MERKIIFPIVLVVGKCAYTHIRNEFSYSKSQYRNYFSKDVISSKHGVYMSELYLQEKTTHIIGFMRRSSIGFWHKEAEEELPKLTAEILHP